MIDELLEQNEAGVVSGTSEKMEHEFTNINLYHDYVICNMSTNNIITNIICTVLYLPL